MATLKKVNSKPSQNKPKWVSEKEQVILKSPVIDVIRKKCHSSLDPKKKHDFYVLNSPDWCNIIPVTSDGKVVLIRQYRIGIDGYALEVPGGVMDPEDDHLEEAAIREMTEETGYVPIKNAKCISLGSTHPNPAIQNNSCHSFVIGPVEKREKQNLDPGEIIELEEVAIEDLPQIIRDGKIQHALMLVTFFLFLTQQKEFSALLRDGLKTLSRPTP